MTSSSRNNPNWNDERVTYRLNCLGVYQCKFQDCQWRDRALMGSGRGRNAVPKGPLRGSCPKNGHGHKFVVHVPCDCFMHVFDKGTYYEVQHHGVHDHLKPQVIKPSFRGLQSLENIIKSNPAATAEELCRGNQSRPPVSALDPCFHNVSHVKYQRKLFQNTKNNKIPTVAVRMLSLNLLPEFPKILDFFPRLIKTIL